MEITQKGIDYTTKFRFQKEKFKYTLTSESGTREYEVSYASMPSWSVLYEDNPRACWYLGVFFCFLSAGMLFFILYTKQYRYLEVTLMFMGIGIMQFLIDKYYTDKFTLYPTEVINVLVRKGKHHDKIVDEIFKRRKAQMLEWYGQINRDNTLEDEIAKFNWLRDEGILSDEDADQKIEQVQWLYQQLNS